MPTVLKGIVYKNRFFSGWNDKLTSEIHHHTFSLEPTNRSSFFSFIKIDLILILTVTGSYLPSIFLTMKQENGIYE